MYMYVCPGDKSLPPPSSSPSPLPQVNLDDPAPVSSVPSLSRGSMSMSLNSDQSLPSDMLLPSESLQQQELVSSCDEEATGGDLQLTADEETAKGVCVCHTPPPAPSAKM